MPLIGVAASPVRMWVPLNDEAAFTTTVAPPTSVMPGALTYMFEPPYKSMPPAMLRSDSVIDEPGTKTRARPLLTTEPPVMLELMICTPELTVPSPDEPTAVMPDPDDCVTVVFEITSVPPLVAVVKTVVGVRASLDPQRTRGHVPR